MVVSAFFKHPFDSGSRRYFKNKQNLIKVSSDIYFNVTSWFQGNIRVKPHFNTQCPLLLRDWAILSVPSISKEVLALFVWNLLYRWCVVAVWWPTSLIVRHVSPASTESSKLRNQLGNSRYFLNIIRFCHILIQFDRLLII